MSNIYNILQFFNLKKIIEELTILQYFIVYLTFNPFINKNKNPRNSPNDLIQEQQKKP